MTSEFDGPAARRSGLTDTGTLDLFVGTYTESLPHVDGKAEGIYRVKIDARTGMITAKQSLRNVRNPSWLAVHPSGRYLYAVNETAEFLGVAGGGVTGFRITEDDGLDLVDVISSHGVEPCHAAIDPAGRFLVVANYRNGSLTVYPIRDDGSLGDPTDVVQHHGSSSHPIRQSGPHAHQVVFDDRRRVFVPDLGLDEIIVYVLEENGRLIRHSTSGLAQGAGPRHMAFHPTGGFAFVINELASTITTFAVSDGRLEPLSSSSTLPGEWQAEHSAAAIRVSPDGRFVYGSNRGPDSIAVFAFRESTGTLEYVSDHPTMGRTPRDFQLSPDGGLLIAANQDSDSLATFHVDATTGRLSPTGHILEIPTPVCLQFAPLPPKPRSPRAQTSRRR